MEGEKQNKAAFYDLDGTLLSCNPVRTCAYYARNDRSIFKSINQIVKMLLSAPLFLGLDLHSRNLFNMFFFRAYRGMHRDQLVRLADDLFEVTLKPSIYRRSEALVRQTRKLGYRTVLVTGALDFTVRPIALHLGVDDVICNRLEFKKHIATGRVLAPLVAETAKATIIMAYAELEHLDLKASCAFSDSTSDIPMLTATGNPVATNPTRQLRRFAKNKQWPIINLSSSDQDDESNPFPPFLGSGPQAMEATQAPR